MEDLDTRLLTLQETGQTLRAIALTLLATTPALVEMAVGLVQAMNEMDD